MVLAEGWKDFTLANDIKANDFLIFRYDGKMHFNVQIFNPSGLERTPKPRKIEQHEETAATSSSTNGKRKRGRPRKYEQTGSVDSAGNIHIYFTYICIINSNVYEHAYTNLLIVYWEFINCSLFLVRTLEDIGFL